MLYLQTDPEVFKIPRDYKHYDENLFRNELLEELQNVNEGTVDCSTFVNVCTWGTKSIRPIKRKKY